MATFLREQQKVKKVYWPGFSDHPGHEVHKRQASGFGAMISFDLGTRDAARPAAAGREAVLAGREPRAASRR